MLSSCRYYHYASPFLIGFSVFVTLFSAAKIMVFYNCAKSFLRKNTFFCVFAKYILQHVRNKGKQITKL